MERPVARTILWAAVVLGGWGWASRAEGGRYVEDFTTTQYKDAVYTTAWWDTASGDLHLYPYVPTRTGLQLTPGFASNVAVAGDHAYVADVSGLVVIDISDLASPALVANHSTPGTALGVAVSGDYAFVADGTYGLRVVDISNPASPTLAGSYNTPDEANAVYVAGDHAYVADGSFGGLQVIDISNPGSPTLAGSYVTPGQAFDVCVSGDYAFVVDYAWGLRVVDISDPTSPTLAGICSTPGGAAGVDVSGDYAFVADRSLGLQVIDVSDPTAPTLAAGAGMPGSAWQVAVSGDRAFVASSNGLRTVDISDPTAPDPGRFYTTTSSAAGVCVAGNHAFLACGDYGLHVIEIAAPMVPALAGGYDTDFALGLCVAGDHLFVADGHIGLRVIDISDPTAPTLAATCDTPGAVEDVFVSGNYAYVVDSNTGAFHSVDISDPTAPTLAGSYVFGNNARAVHVEGDVAFVMVDNAGLKVLDITDPTAPTLLGSGFAGSDVYVSGDYAFLASGASGLAVEDITNPAAPALIGVYNTPGWATRVYVTGDLAFVADGASGLQILDITNPAAPTPLGTYDTAGYAHAVTVAGDYAFLADETNEELLVIDVSDPTAPFYEGSYGTPNDAWEVAVAGEHAYVTEIESGLQVIQVFQSAVYPQYNWGRSVDVQASNDTIVAARLTATQQDSVTWELSANGGASWEGVAPDGSWVLLAAPGTDLRWRSTLSWRLSGDDPSVSDLTIDWLQQSAGIDAIADVGNDQGRQVRIEWTRSGLDFVGASPQILEYAVYRKHDPTAAAGARRAPALEGWDYVTTVPAEADERYAVVVPTLKDSTAAAGAQYSTFFIRARTATPGVHFDSAPDSGYSVDSLEPHVPTGLVVAHNTGSGNRLTWEPCPDPDFSIFRIYRSSDADFVPAPGCLVDETADSQWLDPEHDGGDVHYRVTAVDEAGNESDPATPATTTDVSGPDAPTRFALYQNVPNPFNPTTVVAFDVPQPTHVRLAIYDVSGTLIRTLLDQQLEPGHKRVTWDGKDAAGGDVASGVYFYRLETTAFSSTRKMILLR